MEFITSQSKTVQALISLIFPLIISLIPGIILPLTILKKLKTTPKIIASVCTIFGTLILQLVIIGVIIYTEWAVLPGFVMMFLGGVAMKALIELITGTGSSYTQLPAAVGGKRRRRGN